MDKKAMLNELGDVYAAQTHQGGSKAHPAASEAEAAQRKAEGRTRGKKGASMDRINMCFPSENYEYLRIMSKVKGRSISGFCNDIIAEYREQHAEEYEQTKEFLNKLS